MSHTPNNPGQELERFRDYLCLLARLQLDSRLQAKVDPSGVVQQTLLEAYQVLERSQNPGAVVTAAWLRQILANNLRDEIRRFSAAARDADRERSLEAALDASSSRLQACLADKQSSPSQQAIQQEQLLALAGVLAKLPSDQRLAVELHHLQGCSLAEVAERLGRSKGAVAQLLFRALSRLRELLTHSEERDLHEQ